jgi:hypothetical protein
MTRSYCTLFDKNYLYQGIALYRSLGRHASEFTLYVLCMDDEAHALLARMAAPNLIPVPVEALITPDVAQLRARTTHGQFCWACQPLICQYVLDHFGVDMVTYLESDSLFFSDPEVLFAELGERSVSLVPHKFSAEFDNSASAGLFCVQFNAFRNDAGAREALADWRAACFRYDKSAPKSYPGQTCLDDWPKRFPCVAVLHDPGAGVAPWNIRGYKLDGNAQSPRVNGAPVVFYHYHQYGRFRSGAHELGSYPMTREVIECFYVPYVHELRAAEAAVRAVDAGFGHRREYADDPKLGDFLRSPRERFADYLTVLKRKLRGRYNVFPDAHFRERAQ